LAARLEGDEFVGGDDQTFHHVDAAPAVAAGFAMPFV